MILVGGTHHFRAKPLARPSLAAQPLLLREVMHEAFKTVSARRVALAYIEQNVIPARNKRSWMVTGCADEYATHAAARNATNMMVESAGVPVIRTADLLLSSDNASAEADLHWPLAEGRRTFRILQTLVRMLACR